MEKSIKDYLDLGLVKLSEKESNRLVKTINNMRILLKKSCPFKFDTIRNHGGIPNVVWHDGWYQLKVEEIVNLFVRPFEKRHEPITEFQKTFGYLSMVSVQRHISWKLRQEIEVFIRKLGIPTDKKEFGEFYSIEDNKKMCIDNGIHIPDKVLENFLKGQGGLVLSLISIYMDSFDCQEKEKTKASQVKRNMDKEVLLQIVNYSDKSFAVVGDTKRYKDVLKERGGKFNPMLRCGAGWIFSNKYREDIENLIETIKK